LGRTSTPQYEDLEGSGRKNTTKYVCLEGWGHKNTAKYVCLEAWGHETTTKYAGLVASGRKSTLKNVGLGGFQALDFGAFLGSPPRAAKKGLQNTFSHFKNTLSWRLARNGF